MGSRSRKIVSDGAVFATGGNKCLLQETISPEENVKRADVTCWAYERTVRADQSIGSSHSRKERCNKKLCAVSGDTKTYFKLATNSFC